jgi:protoporphyrinogen oxidase
MASGQYSPVLVLGAGLTGLSAALHLKARGVPVLVVEREDQVGGHARTVEERGFRFDRTGHLLHLRDDTLRSSVLGWLDEEYVEVERKSRVFSQGSLTRYPFQANAHGLPPRIAYECVVGFLAARAASPGPPPRNFLDYCRTTFGAGITDHFLAPYNRRVWGVPLEEIAADAAGRFLPVPTVEEVVAGAVGLTDQELGYNARGLYPRSGIGALARGMHRALGVGVELGQALTAIDLERREVHLPDRTVRFGALVSTIPLPALVRCLVAAPPAVLSSAAALRATPLRYLDVAIGAPARSDLHWVYVPEERHPFYRLGCYSNFSPAMAPAGKSAYYVELVDRAAPALDGLVPRVLAALRDIGFIGPSDPLEFVRARHLDPAYVVLDHRHAGSTADLHRFLAEHRVVSTGRYGGWNYSSMEDALRFGRDAALRAVEVLHE